MNDLTGYVVGKLIVTSFSHVNETRSAVWNCKCACGTVKQIAARYLTRKIEPIRSCGCLSRSTEVKEKKAWRRDPTDQPAHHHHFHRYVCNARKRGITLTLTESEFKELTLQECHYCGDAPREYRHKGRTIQVNGVDRVQNELGYTVENCVPSCSDCNFAKRRMTKARFIDLARRVTEKHQPVNKYILTGSIERCHQLCPRNAANFFDFLDDLVRGGLFAEFTAEVCDLGIDERSTRVYALVKLLLQKLRRHVDPRDPRHGFPFMRRRSLRPRPTEPQPL
jgi:hypothetical protein